ncbi:hypothetical protein [Variovorax sp. Sphag1AA]|uniref:hypothetical protein n=1 Tax=Variovorax sp. Sphag1AA TaxID=2587027 RepID=UPI0016177222|nr:hypothetical protein [Variovorax sp. Sphag1AA]MBB3181245.1 hypothetical protein [Variovorax sp. Sphag1AA]
MRKLQRWLLAWVILLASFLVLAHSDPFALGGCHTRAELFARVGPHLEHVLSMWGSSELSAYEHDYEFAMMVRVIDGVRSPVILQARQPAVAMRPTVFCAWLRSIAAPSSLAHMKPGNPPAVDVLLLPNANEALARAHCREAIDRHFERWGDRLAPHGGGYVPNLDAYLIAEGAKGRTPAQMQQSLDEQREALVAEATSGRSLLCDSYPSLKERLLKMGFRLVAAFHADQLRFDGSVGHHDQSIALFLTSGTPAAWRLYRVEGHGTAIHQASGGEFHVGGAQYLPATGARR